MQSFILVHRTSAQRDAYLDDFFKNNVIGSFDIIRVIGDTSIGIEEVREMQKTLYLKPIKGEKKVIILEEAHTLTIEAQNALLKVLEEPPVHAVFFLSAATTDSLLPTILSRCSLVVLEEEKQELSAEQIASLEGDLRLLFSPSLTARLSLAEKVAGQKDEIGKWLQHAILYLRQTLLNELAANQPTNPHILKNLQEAYRLITTTNTNPRIILEHFFLTS